MNATELALSIILPLVFLSIVVGILVIIALYWKNHHKKVTIYNRYPVYNNGHMYELTPKVTD
jgi:hypothetical protein